HGHIRNYLMATWNKGELQDHYANALGAQLGYKTATYKNFHFGLAGLFTYNTFSSDIAEPDPVSGKLPRYELELFDLEDPENRDDLDRLDELYLDYHSRYFRATAGRFSFNSPFINPQDGRMKPYSVQGVRVQVPYQHKALLTLAWLDHFSPRSTVSWYRAEEVIGIYSLGVDENGNRSGYKHHISTKGVAVASLQFKPNAKLQAETWNYWLENISNTSYGRAVYAVNPNIKMGAEALYQFQVGNGGNAEAAKTYFPDQEQWVLGSMLAFEPQNWHLSLNYLHLGSGGRFLFPKEFGREQFFSTLSRGRLEGLGNSDALTLKARRYFKNQFSVEVGITKTWLPAPTNFRYNKYGYDDSWTGVADIHYKPTLERLKGFQFRLMYVARFSPNTSLPLENTYYKTNFHHLNFVTQLSF
ncbi:MAG: porin, partial [Hymenobacteraceae bacterium]|nr:porin [Hymenobacteraceae bacterium]MDX5394557.1 porin [Hymenobacteraceae bacterium]MDX5510576.1 porin [Hymenobacteraceae bacterium]